VQGRKAEEWNDGMMEGIGCGVEGWNIGMMEK